MANNDPFYRSFPISETPRPWLLITNGDGYEDEKQIFYSISEDQHFKREIPGIQNKHISQASFGWLLLIDDEDERGSCLLNPIAMEIIPLPRLPVGLYTCVLSKPPTETNCHILLLGDFDMFFCRLGDANFVRRSKYIFHGDIMGSATNFQGQIYAWMGEDRGVVTVEFVNGDIVLSDLVKPNGQNCDQFPCNPITKYGIYDPHLIESCGELLLVQALYEATNLNLVESFRIFTIDIPQMEWRELRHTIGNRSILLSRYGGMAVLPPASNNTRFEEDAIYYISITMNDPNLYVYHIGDRSETLLLPYRGTNGEFSRKSWVMI